MDRQPPGASLGQVLGTSEAANSREASINSIMINPCKYLRTYVLTYVGSKSVPTYAGSLINCCALTLFVAPPGAGPGAGEGGAGPGPRAPGPYEIVPGPRAPVAGPVGDPRSGRRSSRPRSGRGRTCESHANIFSYVRERRSAEGVGGRTTDLQDAFLENHRSRMENGCSPGRAGDGGPKPRGWGMGAGRICLRTSSHWRQWRSTTRAA